MKILVLTIYKVWFEEIAQGTKTEEYREIKPFWTKRLSRSYDVIEFRNGYRRNPPTLLIEYKGFIVKRIVHPVTKKRKPVYALLLGRILEIKNYGKIQQRKD